MKPVMGGYTLLEVLLFLAISSIFLAMANVVLQGQSAHTEFSASMNDVNSKMQQWMDEVKNGYTASTASSSVGIGSYNCDLDIASGNPVLSAPAVGTGNATGTNLPCIFLGKAIMVNDKFGGPTNAENKIYAYTVLGRRTFTDSSGEDVNVDSIKNARPTAAVFPVGSASPDINLTETYQIPNGTRLWHAWQDNSVLQTKNLAAFYTDPTSTNNSIISVLYPLHTNIDSTDWANTAWQIPECINLNLSTQNCVNDATTPDNLWPLTTWNLCFESTRDNERALLQIKSPNASGLGAFTTLQLGKAGVFPSCLK
jgi:hypothetical protein